jgi:hypothetical protein
VPSAVSTNAPNGRVFVIVTVTVSPSVREAGCCSVMAITSNLSQTDQFAAVGREKAAGRVPAGLSRNYRITHPCVA